MSAPSALLVATSDTGTRALLRKALHVRAVDVVEAADGVEALALARRLELDIILLDAFLAVLDGISVCARIRALEGINQPLIAIMGLSSERTVELAYTGRGGRDPAQAPEPRPHPPARGAAPPAEAGGEPPAAHGACAPRGGRGCDHPRRPLLRVSRSPTRTAPSST